MNGLTTAWTAHEPEWRGWLRHRLGNPAEALATVRATAVAKIPSLPVR